MDDLLKGLTPWDPNGSLSNADTSSIWNSYKNAGGGHDVSSSLPIGGGLPSGDGGQFTGARSNMDTNPFGSNPGTGQQSTTPPYLQPQGPTTSMPGNISNMVKAIMAGNAEHQTQQQKQGAAFGQTPMNPTTTTGGPSVGNPLSLAPPAGTGMATAPPPITPPPPVAPPPSPTPPVDPTAMTGAGGAGPMGPMGAGAGPLPGMGTGMAGPMPGMGMPQDPVAQALMSPIPGGGGQFGG